MDTSIHTKELKALMALNTLSQDSKNKLERQGPEPWVGKTRTYGR